MKLCNFTDIDKEFPINLKYRHIFISHNVPNSVFELMVHLIWGFKNVEFGLHMSNVIN